MKAYRIAKWTDERGDNTVAGFVVSTTPHYAIESLFGSGTVLIPEGAAIYRPVGHNQPMEMVGTVPAPASPS